MSYVELKNIYKVFGDKPKRALELVKQGCDKETLRNEHGHTLGLDDVSLSINRGEMFVVMGLSGSGKSTLIRHINRLIDPDVGEVLIEGQNILTYSDDQLLDFRRHKVSMVFQRFGLLPHKSILENVAYGLTVAEVDKKTRQAKAHTWIERVGLAGYENAKPKELSGGMQQRVGLARALCTDPDILLMDEPFSALDPLIRSEMQQMLLDIQQEFQKTIIFITHDIDEAVRLGQRIAILKDGVLIQVGTHEELKGSPVDAYVSAFFKDSR